MSASHQMLLAATYGAGVGGTTTWNPSDKDSDISLSLGNLRATGNGSPGAVRAISSKSSGKWQFEITALQTGGSWLIGIGTSAANLATYPGSDTFSYGFHAGIGTKYTNASSSAYSSGFTNGDVIGVTVDFSTLDLTFYKNGVSLGTAFTVAAGTYFPMLGVGSGTGALADLNAGTLNYPVSGFLQWG